MRNPDNEIVRFLREWESEFRRKREEELAKKPPQPPSESTSGGSDSDLSFADILKEDKGLDRRGND